MSDAKYEYISKELSKKFIIESGGEGVGYYLYVYDLDGGNCIADHLQDTIELAIDDAFELYGLPKNSWEK